MKFWTPGRPSLKQWVRTMFSTLFTLHLMAWVFVYKFGILGSFDPNAPWTQPNALTLPFFCVTAVMLLPISLWESFWSIWLGLLGIIISILGMFTGLLIQLGPKD